MCCLWGKSWRREWWSVRLRWCGRSVKNRWPLWLQCVLAKHIRDRRKSVIRLYGRRMLHVRWYAMGMMMLAHRRWWLISACECLTERCRLYDSLICKLFSSRRYDRQTIWWRSFLAHCWCLREWIRVLYWSCCFWSTIPFRCPKQSLFDDRTLLISH